MSSTAVLADIVKGGDGDVVDRHMRERAQLIEELAELEERIQKNDSVTKESAKWSEIWAKQWEFIKKTEEKIRTNIRSHQVHIEKELRHLQNEKSELLKGNDVDAKGFKLNIKG